MAETEAERQKRLFERAVATKAVVFGGYGPLHLDRVHTLLGYLVRDRVVHPRWYLSVYDEVGHVSRVELGALAKCGWARERQNGGFVITHEGRAKLTELELELLRGHTSVVDQSDS